MNTTVRRKILLSKNIFNSIFYSSGCSSMDFKHNVNRFNNLTGCNIIEGHLIISGFKDDQALTNLSFPELREVTEYVIFYQAQNIVKLNHLFPNLSVIRGNKLVAVR